MSLAVAGLLLTAAHAVAESSSLATSAAGDHGARCLPRSVARGLFVGPTPDAAAFAWLAGRGVRTVVSVDGARPEVELAAKHGLRYVHIPFGYDGVPRAAALALTRVARESRGGVYVHCHHGRHRGPVAAVLMARVRGDLCGDDAVRQLLAAAGTDRRLRGLWHDALAFRPPPRGVALPELVAVSSVDPFAAAMSAVGRAWAGLDGAGAGGAAAGGAERHAEAAHLLYEAFTESERSAPSSGRPEAFSAWLAEARATAAQLESGSGRTARVQARQTLADQCRRCHERYRD